MANQGAPQLRTHGPRGERLDVVEFHPAWHALMRRSMSVGLHSSVWDPQADTEAKDEAHKVRAARFYLTSQLESGHLCPLTMTSASVAALSASPACPEGLGAENSRARIQFVEQARHAEIRRDHRHGHDGKAGRHGCARQQERCRKVSEGIYRLSGHKWFMSAPMSDAFIMLAQTKEGMGCFLVPRLLEDGSANGLQFQRLKDKVGNRSNASSEVEFTDTFGFLLGGPDAGIRTILDMVTLTRLDCALASSGMMRASLAEAVHHTRGRSVFGKMLVNQPIMTRVLADMALDVAAATALSFRLADAFDKARGNAEDSGLCPRDDAGRQILVLQDRTRADLRGDGMHRRQRLHRRAPDRPPLPRGSGQCHLGRLGQRHGARRAARAEPRQGSVRTVFAGLARDLGPAGKKTIDVLRAAIALCEQDEGAARLLVEQLALAAGAAELYRLGAGRIADAFIETRLAGGWRSTYGMLDSRFDASYIVDLLYPPAA